MAKLYNDIKIVSGSSNEKLANRIAKKLGVVPVKTDKRRFSDGEIRFNLNESVRGSDVYIIQSTSAPANDNLMELLIMIDSIKRAAPGRINVVIPYYGYARQDRKSRSYDAISAKLVADLLTTAGAEKVITMDLHADQIQGFFNIPVDHLFGSTEIANYIKEQPYYDDDLVIVAPDAGSVKRTKKLARQLEHKPYVLIHKERPEANVAKADDKIIGNVEGKNCVIIDDMIDTGGTLAEAARVLKKNGAKSIRAFCTHGVLSGKAVETLNNSDLEEIICLNTIEIPEEKLEGKIHTLDISPLFAQAISTIHNEASLTEGLGPDIYH